MLVTMLDFCVTSLSEGPREYKGEEERERYRKMERKEEVERVRVTKRVRGYVYKMFVFIENYFKSLYIIHKSEH